jgi:alginate O-acetyltransferase complex protein AlgI
LILGFFKYFNFFIDTLNWMFTSAGVHFNGLEIILPIGISFYIFETISYVVDVYRKDSIPAHSLLDYAVFATFFPRLVAGPIMRASIFLPQLYRGVRFSKENFIIGAQLFAQGLLKKIVVADKLAVIVDGVYFTPWLYSSPTIWLGIFSYSIQIYFDFSGYSDMAMGVARIFGFEMPNNFNLPYTSQSVTEFWQRWHISLSTWLRDYLYIPLGGNRKGGIRTYMNLFITMLLGGLWHGASWNFVLWGGLHGVYLAIERVLDLNKRFQGVNSVLFSWGRVFLVFLLTSVTWVFFRSPTWDITRQVLTKLMFIDSGGVAWAYAPALLLIPVIFLGGLIMRLDRLNTLDLHPHKAFTLAFIVVEFLVIFLFAADNTSPFIYFQF